MRSHGVILAIVCAAQVARADGPILVLETHPRGARVGRVARLASAIDAALEVRGFAAKPTTIRSLAGGRAPRPGALDPDLTPGQIADHLAAAYGLFEAADCAAAIPALKKAIDESHRNPAIVVDDARHLDRLFRAEIGLAVCHAREPDPGAAARVMADLVREFPSRSPSRQEAWGKQGDELYRAAAKIVQSGDRGRLSIASGDPEASIFVDGQLRGRGGAEIVDLVPGDYRVYARPSGSHPTHGQDLDRTSGARPTGRQYLARVAPGGQTRLEIRPDLDDALVIGDEWIGLELPIAARKRLPAYASALAIAWTNRRSVVVLSSIDGGGDRPAIDGVLYRDGVEVRRARLYLDVPDGIGSEKIAEFLAEGTASPSIVVLKGDARAPTEGRRAPRAYLRWGGVATVAVGVALGGLSLKLGLDGRDAGVLLMQICAVSCTSQQERALEDKQSAANQSAIISGVAGGALIVGGAVMIFLSRRHPGRAAVVPLRGGAAASYAVEF